MRLHRVWLTDFRSYEQAELALDPGLTVVVGANGAGKTNLLEAIGYLATLSSFRGAPTEALVRAGADRAVVRAEGDAEGRTVLVEAEIVPGGRSRVLVNKQRLVRARDLLGVLRVTVFSPDDLALVKGGPSERRRFLDELLVALHPRNDTLLAELDRVLRQRSALLKQAGGRLTPEVGFTLDVWDAKLADTGTAVAAARVDALDRLRPALAAAYRDVAGPGPGDRPQTVDARYSSTWWGGDGGLAGALASGRADDVRRAACLVGPHRDEVALTIDGRPSRTHASQGEQRTLALALRLAAHRLVADTIGTAPLLLLDDVFSELDPARSDALVRHLPGGQALLATAGALPPAADVGRTVSVDRVTGTSRLDPRTAGDNPGDSVEESAWKPVR